MNNKIGISILGVALLSSCSASYVEVPVNEKTVYNSILNDEVQKLSKDIVSRTAFKSLKSISSYFQYNERKNYILSPSSLLLAEGAIASVSDNIDLDEFGFSDAKEDLSSLLNAWNFDYSSESGASEACFKSAVLHQQVGSRYQFDEDKMDEFGEDHVSTMISNLDTYREDAQNFFDENIGLKMNMPNTENSSIITYGAIKIKDKVLSAFEKKNTKFYLDDGTNVSVPSYYIASSDYPIDIHYYDGDRYIAFDFRINYTDMLIVLPDKGEDISTIDIADAYQQFQESSVYKQMFGYIPFFHVTNENIDITSAVSSKVDADAKIYSKLLKDGTYNDLGLSNVIQSCDFEFDEYGVEGEAVTKAIYVGSNGSTPSGVTIKVDRPFYAISMKDDFPLFVSRIDNPLT